MEKRRTNLSSKKKGVYGSKVKKATQMLFYKRHQKPGVKGWELHKARFFVALSSGSVTKDKLMGWRIDDLAGLAITISYIISKKGQAARKDIEKLLGEKIPNWKIGLNLDRYVRYGYLMQDEKGQLFLDWRTRAEVDQKALINMLLNAEKQTEEAAEPAEEEAEEQKH